ncbi:transcription factor HIVEP3 [Denticeps clupeoides]|uniref:C2H2-type domain-containing protein n=1 Tax=Denticeps clupeoides TaxID=299321 RepID=A0AAY4BHK9_9TELE|nr:transcription factor HIVEP3-like [Denticeps clupeoides]XP_028820653.1 transcription factor HIVEP3-like [Denticeps clupeoides]XP_028820654.1 transcription factor HIVEP3-like [Denticeps clupeoides]
MEALESELTTEEQSRGQAQPQHTSPLGGSVPQPPSLQQRKQPQKAHEHEAKQPKRQSLERKRFRLQRKHAWDTETFEKDKSTRSSTHTGSAPESQVPSVERSSEIPTSTSHSTEEAAAKGTPKQKRDRRPQKPGKYVCTYCGRACAKPSVLQKHIRSHTGERPYPCAPCGFSFKTKSNLYKHRKSHTHRVKAGLTSGNKEEPSGQEETVSDSDNETIERSSSSSCTKKQGTASQATFKPESSPAEQLQGMGDSHAVKKRLAMRLSKIRQAPLDSSDEASSSFTLGSKGSTESGYFSRSESTEQSQDSPPDTSAKSYAEIILGKYGRLGHLQRASRHQHQLSAGQEGKGIPFNVPKKQVIDHITKLITINEAVVDTSKIDSVKPRRFSLSRRISSETAKVTALKESLVHCTKESEPLSKGTGSITLGVPCERFQNQTTTAPLLRSHSVPSAATTGDASNASNRNLRLSQSFDEQPQPQGNRRHGLLRRQPAIELPFGTDITPDKLTTPNTPFHYNILPVLEEKQRPLEPNKCEECGTDLKDWETYKTHKLNACRLNVSQQPEVFSGQAEHPQKMHPLNRPGALLMRKRRKEDSLELDDSSALSSLPMSAPAMVKDMTSGSYERPTKENIGSRLESEPTTSLKGISVIQHTSLFEKTEANVPFKSQGNEEPYLSKVMTHDVYHSLPQKKCQPYPAKPTSRKLVRQHNVQVPEILVTEEPNVVPRSLSVTISTTKETEKADEFQWPQRSSTLAQLPIEKLPPKKKRLRLAEAAQSSGESSFESLSLPRSPSEDSNISHASSRSASLEESSKPDADVASVRRSRATHTLTVPTGSHNPHREMRRSASEQAPHVPQPMAPISEIRSKSFDYSCLSPERSPAGWKERRKCLLIRHTTVRDTDEEELPSNSKPIGNPSQEMPKIISPGLSQSPGIHISHPLNQDQVNLGHLDQPQSLTEDLACQVFAQEIPKMSPLVYLGHQGSHHGPTGFPRGSSQGAARAHYSPLSTGLKLEIPAENRLDVPGLRAFLSQITNHQAYPQQSQFDISPSNELLRPTGKQSVVVRFQANTPTHADAIYTTLSQIPFSSSQELVSCGLNLGPIDATVSNLGLKVHLPTTYDSQEPCRSSGVGGSKRVLSPASSLELSPDSGQQQKRVKEEEDANEEDFEAIQTRTLSQQLQEKGSQTVGQKTDSKEPMVPSLHTSPSFSWCYLNYIKPNPSAQSDHHTSVYSSWCTSTCNPNPPGLTSKQVLSLLHCKQTHSPITYTMAAMSPAEGEKKELDGVQEPSLSEVRGTLHPDHTEAQHVPPTEKKSETLGKKDKEEEEGEETEDSLSNTSRCSEPPRVQICEGGYRSNEEYVYVRGRGRGRYVCEECGIRCKKPSMLRKHIRLHTDMRPYVCQHCNFAFKTKGNLTKHMKSKAHGKKCNEGSISCQDEPEDEEEEEDEEGGGGSEDYCSVGPETLEEHQFSDAEDSEEEGDEDDVPPLSTFSPEEAPKSPDSALSGHTHHQHREPAARRESLVHCPTSMPRPTPSTCPERPLSPNRPLVAVGPQPVGGSTALQATLSGSNVQHQATRLRDRPRTFPSRPSGGARLEVASSPPSPVPALLTLGPRCGPPRDGSRLFSHLPLHCQQLGRAPSLLIPIGGIHMVPPRCSPHVDLSPGPPPGGARDRPDPLRDKSTEPEPSKGSEI